MYFRPRSSNLNKLKWPSQQLLRYGREKKCGNNCHLQVEPHHIRQVTWELVPLLSLTKIKNDGELSNSSKRIKRNFLPMEEKMCQYLPNHWADGLNSFRYEFLDPKYVWNQPDMFFSNPKTPLETASSKITVEDADVNMFYDTSLLMKWPFANKTGTNDHCYS